MLFSEVDEDVSVRQRANMLAGKGLLLALASVVFVVLIFDELTHSYVFATISGAFVALFMASILCFIRASEIRVRQALREAMRNNHPKGE